jgi:prefoldin alpha subunit
MNEKELTESIRTLEVYRMQLQELEQQIELIRNSLETHNRAKETMENYKNLEEGAETLIPIGADSFLFASVKQPNQAMLNIGSDVMIELDMDKAIGKLDERIEEMEGAMDQLNKKSNELTTIASELTAKVQEAYTQGASGE